MNRNELKTIAEGFKKARPFDPTKVINGEMTGFMQSAWETTVYCVADALQLEGKPRSIFLAACGLIHITDQG